MAEFNFYFLSEQRIYMPQRKEPQLNFDATDTNDISSASLAVETNSNPDTTHSTGAPVKQATGFLSFIAWLGLLISLAALGAAAWLFIQAEQQMSSAEDLEAKLVGRLEEIELALFAADKSFNQTGTSLNSQVQQLISAQQTAKNAQQAAEDKLKWADSEIRKLWVIAHQTNKPAIEKLNKALDKTAADLEAQLKQQQTQLNGVETKLNSSEKAITSQLANLEKSINSSSQKLKTLESKAAELTKQLQTLETSTKRQLGELSLTHSSLREDLGQPSQVQQELNSLTQRLTALEISTADKPPLTDLYAQLQKQQETLRSLEASRRQLMQRLTQLDAELQSLHP